MLESNGNYPKEHRQDAATIVTGSSVSNVANLRESHTSCLFFGIYLIRTLNVYARIAALVPENAACGRVQTDDAKKQKTHSEFSIAKERCGANVKGNSRQCNDCIQRHDAEMKQMSCRSVTEVLKRKREE